MPKKNNGLVDLKVVTAVLEERFKNHREHSEKILDIKFKGISDQLTKGSKQMKDMKTEIQKNTKFREKIKIIVATISSVFGAIGGFLVLLGSKLNIFK